MGRASRPWSRRQNDAAGLAARSPAAWLSSACLPAGSEFASEFRFIPTIGLAVLILARLHSVVGFSLQIAGVGAYFAVVMAATVMVSPRRRFA